MTLAACRECSGRVSRSAEACPHCGAPGPEKPEAWLDVCADVASGTLSFFFWAVVALTVLGLLAA